MLKLLYVLLLAAASIEDYRYRRVSPHWTASVLLVGLWNCILRQKDRWVTLALTCACIVLLYLLYRLVLLVGKRSGHSWKLGGADVKLIPGMMLFQGWDAALSGIFTGLTLAALYYLLWRRKQGEIPLVPWMTAGCLLWEAGLALQNIIS